MKKIKKIAKEYPNLFFIGINLIIISILGVIHVLFAEEKISELAFNIAMVMLLSLMIYILIIEIINAMRKKESLPNPENSDTTEMTAEERFKRLGYTREEKRLTTTNERMISYVNQEIYDSYDDGKPYYYSSRSISFFVESKEIITKSFIRNKTNYHPKAFIIDEEMSHAIMQQMKELEWIE